MTSPTPLTNTLPQQAPPVEETPSHEGDQVVSVLAEWFQFTSNLDIPALIAGAGLVAAAIGVGAVIVKMRTSLADDARRIEQTTRDRSAAEELKDLLPVETVTVLSAKEGERRAREHVLDAITNDFRRIDRVLDKVYDEKIVVRTEASILGKWHQQRRAEFCLRYYTPLAVLLDPIRLQLLSQDAELPAVPHVVGIGEQDDGLYALLETDAPVSLVEWSHALALFRVELDSPQAVFRHADANTVSLELRDRDYRAPLNHADRRVRATVAPNDTVDPPHPRAHQAM